MPFGSVGPADSLLVSRFPLCLGALSVVVRALAGPSDSHCTGGLCAPANLVAVTIVCGCAFSSLLVPLTRMMPAAVCAYICSDCCSADRCVCVLPVPPAPGRYENFVRRERCFAQ